VRTCPIFSNILINITDNKPFNQKRPPAAPTSSKSSSVASQHRETNQSGSFEAILPVLKVGYNQTLIEDWFGNLHDVHLANINQRFPSLSHQGLFIQEFTSAFFHPLLNTRPNA